VNAEDPTLVYASAASGPGRAHGTGFSNVAIYRRGADGQWEPVMEELAAFPYALCSDPEPPPQRERGEGWEELACIPAGLQALAAVSA
jgi:hypothetical protein